MRIEELTKKNRHLREGFSCGKDDLDRFLKTLARQHQERRLGASYLLIDEDEAGVRLVGYYTLASCQIIAGALPADMARKYLPDTNPATLLARLAIDQRYQGQGCGEHLLADALKRALLASRQIGAAFVLVDAKDDNAVAYYRRFGFQPVAGDPRRLFLPMKTIADLFD